MKPAIGRIVHYVIPSGPHKGAHRAAIITYVYADTIVNLTIFADQVTDCTSTKDYYADSGLLRGFGIRPGNPDEPNTWHWPEREE